MDWNAAAAIANLVSAAAVVASLVYLALQVRHSTRVARAAAQDSVVSAARAVTLQLGQDHYQYRVGVLDGETWRGWEQMIHHYVAAPGLRAYFELRRDAFPRRFQDLIDAIPRTEASLTVDDMARKVAAAPRVA